MAASFNYRFFVFAISENLLLLPSIPQNDKKTRLPQPLIVSKVIRCIREESGPFIGSISFLQKITRYFFLIKNISFELHHLSKLLRYSMSYVDMEVTLLNSRFMKYLDLDLTVSQWSNVKYNL